MQTPLVAGAGRIHDLLLAHMGHPRASIKSGARCACHPEFPPPACAIQVTVKLKNSLDYNGVWHRVGTLDARAYADSVQSISQNRTQWGKS